jgi:hypothetical protein
VNTIPRSEVISLISTLLGVEDRLVLRGVRSVYIDSTAVTVSWAGREGLTSIILIGD